jgi:hypothetical protein
MIRAAVFYNDSGEIVSCKTGSEAGIYLTAESSEFNYILFEDAPDVNNKYVANEKLVDMPTQPSEFYEFNYSTKSWDLQFSFAQQGKWSEIKKDRDSEEFGTFVWNGFTFDCDETSQRRIQGAVQLAALDTSTVMDWTLADNTSQTFNATELQQIGQALGAHVNACHVKGRGLRDQIDAAQTEAELSVISW